jgi:hypothetical protein
MQILDFSALSEFFSGSIDIGFSQRCQSALEKTSSRSTTSVHGLQQALLAAVRQLESKVFYSNWDPSYSATAL